MNWVQAYLDCEPKTAFKTLREQLKADFEQWQVLHPATKQTLPEFNVESDEKLNIKIAVEPYFPWSFLWSTAEVKQYPQPQIEVRVLLQPSQSEGDVQSYTFTPKVNSKGECRFTHGDEEKESWEISRLMLSHILFR